MKQSARWIFPILFSIISIGIIYQSYFLFHNIENEISQPQHFPYQSFAYITIDLEFPQQSMPDTGGAPHAMSSRGSGIAIGSTSGGGTAILTANHVCNPPPFLVAVWTLGAVKTISVTDFYGNSYPARIILNNVTDDLCLLEIENFPHPLVPFSLTPSEIGDKVYSVAAPLAFFSPGMVPLLDVYYSGDTVSSNGIDSVYTVPAREGSSGSSIINERGEIVGVVHSSLTGFQSITICSTHNQVRAFLIQFVSLLDGTLAQ